jgi:hypothetical protein
MLDVIIAGLLPMFDRERLAIVLAVEIGAYAGNSPGFALLAFGEEDFWPVTPKHKDVAPLRAVEAAEAQEFLAKSIRQAIMGR